MTFEQRGAVTDANVFANIPVSSYFPRRILEWRKGGEALPSANICFTFATPASSLGDTVRGANGRDMTLDLQVCRLVRNTDIVKRDFAAGSS